MVDVFRTSICLRIAQSRSATTAFQAFSLPDIRAVRSVTVPAPATFHLVDNLVVVVARDVRPPDNGLPVPVRVPRIGRFSSIPTHSHAVPAYFEKHFVPVGRRPVLQQLDHRAARHVKAFVECGSTLLIRRLSLFGHDHHAVSNPDLLAHIEALEKHNVEPPNSSLESQSRSRSPSGSSSRLSSEHATLNPVLTHSLAARDQAADHVRRVPQATGIVKLDPDLAATGCVHQPRPSGMHGQNSSYFVQCGSNRYGNSR